MCKRPAVPIALAFAAGILAAGLDLRPSAWLYLIAAVAIAAVASSRKRLPVLPILLATMIVGWARCGTYMEVAGDDISRHALRKTLGFQGMIVADPDVRENRTYAIVQAEQIFFHGGATKTSGRVMVTVYSPRRSELEYGRRIYFRSTIRPPMPARNPGEFSWGRYLARQRIYATASVRGDDDIEILPGRTGNPLISGSLGIKRWIEGGIDALFPGAAGQLVKGILLGNYALLPPDMISAFSRSGTLHLLAASGFNCMVLITVFGIPLTHGLDVGRSRRSVILICLLVIYVLIIGAKPSIVRATIMASIALLAYPLRRSTDGPNLLFAAALVILAIRPTDLFDVGFQLSFAAVAAIMGVLPPLRVMMLKMGWMPDPAGKQRGKLTAAGMWACRNSSIALATTIAATLGTIPLTACYFNYVSIISPIANTLVAATISPLFSLGLSAPFVQNVPMASEIVGFGGTRLSLATLSTVSYLGNLSMSAVSMPSPGLPAICGYYIMLWGVTAYASTKLVRG